MPQTRVFKTADMTALHLQSVADALEKGAVAVLPTDTVYGIAAGVFCEEAIRQIYRIKERPADVPLQILTGSVQQARTVAEFSPAAEKLAAAYWPGALTAVLPPSAAGKPLARGFAGLGLRIPGNTFVLGLLAKMHMPLACTSANLHKQPVLTDEKTVLETFNGKVDFIFLGGTLSPVASSVVDLTGKKPVLLREAAVPRIALEKTMGLCFDSK